MTLGDLALHLPALPASRPCPAMSQPCAISCSRHSKLPPTGWLETTDMPSLRRGGRRSGIKVRGALLWPVAPGVTLAGLLQLLVALRVPWRVAAALPPLSHGLPPCVRLSVSSLLTRTPYWIGVMLHALIVPNHVCKHPISKWGHTVRIQAGGDVTGMLSTGQAIHLVLAPGSSTKQEDRRGWGRHVQSPQSPGLCHVWGQLCSSVLTKQGLFLLVASLSFLARLSPSSVVGGFLPLKLVKVFVCFFVHNNRQCWQ